MNERVAEFFQCFAQQVVGGRGRTLFFDAAGDEHLPRTGDGDVEEVEFLARCSRRFGLEQRCPRQAAILAAAVEREVIGRGIRRRPVGDDVPGVAAAWRVVGPEQPDNRRFQSLGTVDGKQAHAPGAERRCGNFAFIGRILGVGPCELAQFVDETRQAGVAPAVEVECEQQQGVEIGFNPVGQRGRDGQPVTGEDFTLMIDAVEQVMRRQTVGIMLPGVEQAGGASEAWRDGYAFLRSPLPRRRRVLPSPASGRGVGGEGKAGVF